MGSYRSTPEPIERPLSRARSRIWRGRLFGCSFSKQEEDVNKNKHKLDARENTKSAKYVFGWKEKNEKTGVEEGPFPQLSLDCGPLCDWDLGRGAVGHRPRPALQAAKCAIVNEVSPHRIETLWHASRRAVQSSYGRTGSKDLLDKRHHASASNGCHL